MLRVVGVSLTLDNFASLTSACAPPILAMSDLAAMTTYQPLALRPPSSPQILPAATRQSAFQVDEVQRRSPAYNLWDWLLRLAETMRGGSLGARSQLTEHRSPANQSQGRTQGEAWVVMPVCPLPIRALLAHHLPINHHP